MSIIYEVNPPKTATRPSKDEAILLLAGLRRRIAEIAECCDGLHITESVLGTSRLSPIITAQIIKLDHPDLHITTSMRIVERDIADVKKYIQNAIDAKIDGILVIKGDPSQKDPKDLGLVPSQVVKDLDANIDLFLSIPSNPNFEKIQKKIDANPKGFITQVIHSVPQVSRICDTLKKFKIIPIILVPSEKNLRSAEFLKLDWSNYKDNTSEFIQNVQNISGDVLITSPNDHESAKQILYSIK